MCVSVCPCEHTCICEVRNKRADEKLNYQAVVRTAEITNPVAATQEENVCNILKKGN